MTHPFSDDPPRPPGRGRVGTIVIVAVVVALVLMATRWGHAPSIPPLDQRVGQMLMLGFPGASPDHLFENALARQIGEGKVGGVIMLGYNFKTKDEVFGLTKLFRTAARGIPVFIALDQEGGLVQRLGPKLGYRSFPPAETVGREMSPDEAAKSYAHLADTVREAGFNMNLGPVVDLGANPLNPLVATHRVYGSDPATVIEYSRAFIRAQRHAGLQPVLKHFPGHGSSLSDTHDDFVDISDTWKRVELEPYRALIASRDAGAIMIGHLIHRELAPEGCPVSLSETALMKTLRGELGFEGLILCDDLQMAAIRNHYGPETALVSAINAGVDILMITNQFDSDPELGAKINALICKAVADGRIKTSTIDAAWKRIVHAKASLGR